MREIFLFPLFREREIFLFFIENKPEVAIFQFLSKFWLTLTILREV